MMISFSAPNSRVSYSECENKVLYALDVCNLDKRSMQSLNFTFNRFFIRGVAKGGGEMGDRPPPIGDPSNFLIYEIDSFLLTTAQPPYAWHVFTYERR